MYCLPKSKIDHAVASKDGKKDTSFSFGNSSSIYILFDIPTFSRCVLDIKYPFAQQSIAFRFWDTLL